jgi:diguanylate cyclase (GGDEF)-like protein
MTNPLIDFSAHSLRHFFRLCKNWRIGISGHLGISFAAVGVLAAIANVIVEQGVSIIEITRVASVPVAKSVERPRVTVAPAPLDAPLSRLADAADRYEGAIAIRAQVANPENDARVTAAERHLRAEQADLASSSAGGALRELEDVLGAYRKSAATLIALADRRRTTIETYAARLDSMHDRLGQSINRSWTILGRVVARQSVLGLRRDLDELRNAFVALRSTRSLDPPALQWLTEKEAAFAATFEGNERGFLRSEGREWVRDVRSELGELVSLRAALVSEWQRLDEAEADFGKASGRAHAAVSAISAPAQRASESAISAASPFVGPPVLDATPFVGPLLLDSSSASSVSNSEIRVIRQETDASKKRLVAWVTGSVLVVVLLISIGTVRSIVVPIRRLLYATSQLGRYGKHEPVPRGGIKELDTLAQSFNQMAEELVASRQIASEQRSHLEQRVRERTRELRELADRDPLTGLANRRQLLALLESALAAAHRDGQLVAVFFLDLDNFKNINDSMGHGFGDEVLKAIAQRLTDVAHGIGFASRLGGDEFTVVLTGGEDLEHVRRTGLQVIAAFDNPLSIGNRELLISVSVGASIYPDHEVTAEGLLKAADAALFRAKALGRSQLSVYTPELLAEAATRFSTEQGLRRAVERGDFELVFQPEVCVDTLETALVEALVRWRMPDGRLAAPGEFLAVAEESGLITEIGDWVLHSAIEAAARWHHGEWPAARVAINVSPRQLLDHRFAEKVQALLLKHELPARCIEIELTETVLQTGVSTIDTLHRLHAAGIAIALDDFGTGYSSLASVEKLPLTRVKIDRSLIHDVAASSRSAAIARAIIRLCHDLKLGITAEGVETREQLDVLIRHRPIYLQGYLLSKAVPAEDLLATVNRLSDELPLLLVTARDIGYDEIVSPRAFALDSKSRSGMGGK